MKKSQKKQVKKILRIYLFHLILLFQHVINVKGINEILYFLFCSSLLNLLCSLCPEHISVGTSCFSSTQEPHVAHGSWLDSSGLELLQFSQDSPTLKKKKGSNLITSRENEALLKLVYSERPRDMLVL